MRAEELRKITDQVYADREARRLAELASVRETLPELAEEKIFPFLKSVAQQGGCYADIYHILPQSWSTAAALRIVTRFFEEHGYIVRQELLGDNGVFVMWPNDTDRKDLGWT